MSYFILLIAILLKKTNSKKKGPLTAVQNSAPFYGVLGERLKKATNEIG